MKYLLKFIFPFLRSGIEAKRGVAIQYAMPPELAESGERSILALGTHCPAVCGIQREADLFIQYFSNIICTI